MDEKAISEIAATFALIDAAANQQRLLIDEALDLAVEHWTTSRDPKLLELGKLLSQARAKLEIIDELRLPF